MQCSPACLSEVCLLIKRLGCRSQLNTDAALLAWFCHGRLHFNMIDRHSCITLL